MLRVDEVDVILLEKIVAHGFPVGVERHRLVFGEHHVLEMIGSKVVDDRTQVVLQRRRIRVHIDPHSARPERQLHRLQRALAFVHGGAEALCIGDFDQPTIQRVTPAVVGAGYLLHRAAFTGENTIAAVLADIVERADFALLVAQHYNRLAAQRVDEVVTRIRQVGHEARKEPAARPDPLPLRGQRGRGGVIVFVQARP